MASVKLQVDDVDRMEAIIRSGPAKRRQGYDVTYLQLSRGSFGGSFVGTRSDVDWLAALAADVSWTDVALPSDHALDYLSVQRYGARVRIRGASPRDRSAFYVLGPSTRLVRHRGAEVAPGSLIAVPPGSEMDFLVEGVALATFSFEERTVASLWRAAGYERSPTTALPLAAPLAPSLFALATSMLGGDGACLRKRERARHFEETFASALAESRAEEPRTRGAQRRRSVRRAEAILRENLAHAVPSHALAQAAGVPLRTLQHAFRAEFGVGPHRYHTSLRMRAARRYLLDRNPDDGSVAQAATMHGFEHLGRFAVEYRRQFGEPPSATLRRRSGARA